MRKRLKLVLLFVVLIIVSLIVLTDINHIKDDKKSEINKSEINEEAKEKIEENVKIKVINAEDIGIKENEYNRYNTTKEEKNINKSKEEISSNLISYGDFKLTAYCACSKCCGKWAGSPTASGVMPKANHTIAVDISVIPFGTEVIINGKKYVAEDTGSAIKGNRIDIFFDSHSDALNFGVKFAEVFVVR